MSNSAFFSARFGSPYNFQPISYHCISVVLRLWTSGPCCQYGFYERLILVGRGSSHDLLRPPTPFGVWLKVFFCSFGLLVILFALYILTMTRRFIPIYLLGDLSYEIPSWKDFICRAHEFKTVQHFKRVLNSHKVFERIGLKSQKIGLMLDSSVYAKRSISYCLLKFDITWLL